MTHLAILTYLILSLKVLAAGDDTDLSDTDYCSMCTHKESHTACRYWSGAATAPCSLQPLSQEEKVRVLKAHNTLRERVALGKEGQQPAAANMLRLRWDEELEAVAARWAIQCQDQHDECRESPRFAVGQNLAWLSHWNLEKNVQMWYDEVKGFDPSGVDSYQFDSSTSHYTQLVWAGTYFLGCAKTDRGSARFLRFMFVCNYGPSGNWLTRPIYQKGGAASACPKDSTKDSEYPGLCSRPGADFVSLKLHPNIRMTASLLVPSMPLVLLIVLGLVSTEAEMSFASPQYVDIFNQIHSK